MEMYSVNNQAQKDTDILCFVFQKVECCLEQKVRVVLYPKNWIGFFSKFVMSSPSRLCSLGTMVVLMLELLVLNRLQQDTSTWVCNITCVQLDSEATKSLNNNLCMFKFVVLSRMVVFRKF